MAQEEVDLARLYKSGMRRLASGVSLITSSHNDIKAGLVATAVSSVAADPPTLLICVNKSASAHNVIESSSSFAVNLLATSDEEMVAAFSDPARRAERFRTGSWSVAETGVPILESAVAAFDCQVVEKISYGTHTIFLGEVRAVSDAGDEGDPLVYHNQRMQRLTSIPPSTHG